MQRGKVIDFFEVLSTVIKMAVKVGNNGDVLD